VAGGNCASFQLQSAGLLETAKNAKEMYEVVTWVITIEAAFGVLMGIATLAIPVFLWWSLHSSERPTA
jgi:hypothetical protein